MGKRLRRLGFGVAIAVATLWSLLGLISTRQLVPSASMAPTLNAKEHILVLPFVFREPSAGDVILFRSPSWVPRNPGTRWSKRVLAVAGQHVKRIGQTFVVDDVPFALTERGETTYADPEGDRTSVRSALLFDEAIGGAVHGLVTAIPPITGDWPSAEDPRASQRGLTCTDVDCTVQPGFIFVVGDNRDASSDSRVWGGVPVENVEGFVWIVWLTAWRLVH